MSVILSTLPNKTIKYRFVRGKRISLSDICISGHYLQTLTALKILCISVTPFSLARLSSLRKEGKSAIGLLAFTRFCIPFRNFILKFLHSNNLAHMGSFVPAQNPLSWIFFTLGTVVRFATLVLTSYLAPRTLSVRKSAIVRHGLKSGNKYITSSSQAKQM